MKTQTSALDWIILPPGNTAILRYPFSGEIKDCQPPEGLINLRLATACELVAANKGYPFPWGTSAEAHPDKTSRLWKEKQIGIGGLVHKAWFVTSDGRFGGAPNVPKLGPGALRHYMYLDGGKDPSGTLAENEGFALVAELGVLLRPSLADYRKIQMHAAEHVTGDKGAIIVFPKDETDSYNIGFVGRCMSCPSPELISMRALKDACPEVKMKLHPDWQNWTV